MGDNLSYDDDGNPVFIKSRPPKGSKARKSFSGPASNFEVCSTPTKENKTKNNSKKRASVSGPSSFTPESTSDGRLAAIFEIDGKSFDVVFEESKISWTPVGAAGSKPKVQRKRSRSLIRRLSSLSLHKDSNLKFSSPEDDCCVYFQEILGIVFRRTKHQGSKSGQGLVQGFSVSTFERKDFNRLKEKTITFNHPSEDVCHLWGNKLNEIIDSFRCRPRKIKVFLQPHAGRKTAKATYCQKIRPLFEAAGIEENCTEIAHNEHIRMEFCHFDLDEYDSIICVGGDGTVNGVVNGLLNRIQEVDGVEMRAGVNPHKSRLPVGIIPLGTTNQISHSIQGTDDAITAAIHVILGNKISVNLCSIYHQDKFIQWGFNCHYGFFGNVLKHLTRYNLLGDKRLEAAFMKSLTKKKFRSYECEVKFFPAEDMAGHPKDGNPCHRHCDTCDMDPLNESRGSTYSDVVESLNDPLNVSNTSSTIIDLSNEKPNRTAKGEYISLSLMSLSGHSDLAPLGMSMFSHMNDGCIDLILVKNTDRHEFVRYLRRHGNKKNQLEFPFVETYRCREVHFHIRLKETWKHKDYGFNDIEYEVDRRKRSAESRSRTVENIEVIDDLLTDEDDDDDDDLADDIECLDNEVEFDNMSFKNGSMGSGANTPGSAGSRKSHSRKPSLVNSRNSSRAGSTADMSKSGQEHVPWSYRPTLVELDKARRKDREKKKDLKKKEKAEAKMKGIWNIDNEICKDLDLQFRGHASMLRMFGKGITLNPDPDAIKLGCLSVF